MMMQGSSVMMNENSGASDDLSIFEACDQLVPLPGEELLPDPRQQPAWSQRYVSQRGASDDLSIFEACDQLVPLAGEELLPDPRQQPAWSQRYVSQRGASDDLSIFENLDQFASRAGEEPDLGQQPACSQRYVSQHGASDDLSIFENLDQFASRAGEEPDPRQQPACSQRYVSQRGSDQYGEKLQLVQPQFALVGASDISLTNIGQQKPPISSANYLNIQHGGVAKTIFFSKEIFGNATYIKYILRKQCNNTNQCYQRTITIEVDSQIKSAASLQDNLNINTSGHSYNSLPALPSQKVSNSTPRMKSVNDSTSNKTKQRHLRSTTRKLNSQNKSEASLHDNLNINKSGHSDNSLPALRSHKVCNSTSKMKCPSDRSGLKNTEKSQIVTRQKKNVNANAQVFQCNYCNFVAKVLKGLQTHKGKLHDKDHMYHCSDCSFGTSQIRDFQRHQVKVHNYERPYSCEYCNYRATTKVDMRSHTVRLHFDKAISSCYQQNKCNKKSSRPNHQATNNPTKYRCMDCAYSSYNPVYLERHKVKVHNYPRLHACTHCKYSAITKPDLMTHIILVHPGKRNMNNKSKENSADSQVFENLPCEYCGLHFKSRRALHYHTNKKHGIKGFRCSECNFSANNDAMLNQHLCRVHNYPRPYACHLCTYSGTIKDNLKMHLIREHLRKF